MSAGRTRTHYVSANCGLIATHRVYYHGSCVATYPYYRNPSSGDYSFRKTTMDELHAGPPYTTGGPFLSIESDNPWWQIQGGGEHRATVGSFTYVSEGAAVPNNWGLYGFTLSDMNNSGTPLSTYDVGYMQPTEGEGASAWNRFKPKTMNTDVSRFLGELKDFPGMMREARWYAQRYKDWRAGRSLAKHVNSRNTAKAWVSYSFSWKPFVSDLFKLFQLIKDAQKRLTQLKRDNGRWIRRRGSYPSSSVLESYHPYTNLAPAIYPGGLTQCANRSAFPDVPGKWGDTWYTLKEESITWFAGAFRFWVPSLESDDALSDIMNVMRAYGLMISPKLVWDLTPWSWLLDWFANIGDIIDNLQSQMFDNLVAQYAYIMRRTTLTNSNDSIAVYLDGPETYSWTQKVEAKSRMGASPFGFGVDMSSITPRQVSILGALGLSRLR